MNDEVESALLGFLRIRENYEKYAGDIKADYFSNEYVQHIYKYVEEFFTTFPDRKMASKKNLRMMVNEVGDEKKIIIEIIKTLSGGNSSDTFLISKIGEFVKNGIVRQAIKDNYAALEGKAQFDVEGMYGELQRARDFSLTGSTLYDYTTETDSLHRTFGEDEESIYTGIEVLDNAIIPAPCLGEEWIIIAPPGRGKTLTLLNILVAAACQGHTVIYITCGDQGRIRVQKRIDAMASGLSYRRLEDPTKRTLGLLRKRVRENIISKGGQFYIQDWSDTSATPLQVESLVKAVPGVSAIGVDYPDIMRASTKYFERRHEIASIFTDLRRLAVKHNVLVWAGSQANRSALNKQRVTMSDVAEDIQKCWVADGIITFCQTEEEKDEGMGRFYIAKARRPPLRDYEVKFLIDDKNGRIE